MAYLPKRSPQRDGSISDVSGEDYTEDGETIVPDVIDIGTLIERSPEIRKGLPCIAGTGVTVQRIAQWHNLGLTPEEIAAKIEHLTLAQIHAALAYYHANSAEIDDEIAPQEAAVEEIFPESIARN